MLYSCAQLVKYCVCRVALIPTVSLGSHCVFDVGEWWMNSMCRVGLVGSFTRCSDLCTALVSTLGVSVSDLYSACGVHCHVPTSFVAFFSPSLFLRLLLFILFIYLFIYFFCCSHSQMFWAALVHEFGVPCMGAGYRFSFFYYQSVLHCAYASTVIVALFIYYYCKCVIV